MLSWCVLIALPEAHKKQCVANKKVDRTVFVHEANTGIKFGFLWEKDETSRIRFDVLKQNPRQPY